MAERILISVIALGGAILLGILIRTFNRSRVLSRTVTPLAPAISDKNEQAPTLVYFWAQSCVQCASQQRAIDEVKDTLERMGHHVNVLKYNALESPELARKMRVLTLPTTVWLDRRGSVTDWNAGLTRSRTLLQQYDRQAGE